MNCQQLKADISRWFDQELHCEGSGDAFTLTLPILKPDGDALEIGIESSQSGWKLTDFGDTQAHFFLAGVDLSGSRGDEYQQIVKDYKLHDAEKQLSVISEERNLSSSIFEFAHALQAIFALQLTVRPQFVTRDFQAIVARFFIEQKVVPEVPATPLAGSAGNWKFNFVLNRVQTPTLLKTLSPQAPAAAFALAERAVFEINDIRRAGNSTKAVVIGDDEAERARNWTPRVLRLFDGYAIPFLAFNAKREELISLARQYVA